MLNYGGTGGVGADDPRLNRLRPTTPPGNQNVAPQSTTGDYVSGLLNQFGLSPQTVKGMTWQQIQALVGQRGGAQGSPQYQQGQQFFQQAQQSGQTPEQYFASLPPPRTPQMQGQGLQ